MAEDNKNIGGSTGAQRAGKEQIGISKEARKELGDYKDILKESENLLKKINNQYENIEARINALNKGSINIKQINNEIFKTKQKDILLEKQLKDVQKNRTDGVDNYLDILQQISKAEGDIKDQLLGQAEYAFRNLNVEEQSVANLLQAKKITEEGLEFANKKLQTEKAANANIGVTGRLLGQIGKYLGANNDVYEEMVEASKNSIEKTKEGLSLTERLGFVWKSIVTGIRSTVQELGGVGKATVLLVLIGLKKLADYTGDFARNVANGVSDFMKMSGDQVIGKITSGISGLVKNIPLVGGLLSGIVDAFGKLVELSLQEDDAITKFGRELGVSKKEAAAINDQFLKIQNSSGRALVTSRALVESQKELANELGVNNVLSGEILSTNIELAKLAGLDVKTRSAIAESATITGKSAKETTTSILGQVAALKSTTGISFNYKKILSEAANLSGVLALQFAKYPEKLTKALVTTKAMGLELSKLDSMANSFLDFESSISKEFEAQLLTGKDINLAKAREAFLNNDLAAAAAEITKQTGSASDYLNMNRIQQESIADAMGMSRDEMANMLKQQEMFAKLGATDLKSAQAKVEALKAEGKSRAEIAKIVGEEAYQNLTNASTQEKIAGFIEKIQSAVANFLSKSPIMSIIDRAIDFLSKPENITAIVIKIQGVFATIMDIMGGVAAAIMKVANFFNADIDESIIKKAKSGGAAIRSLDLTGGTVAVGNNVANQSTPTTTATKPADVSSGGLKRPNFFFSAEVKLDTITGQAAVAIAERDASNFDSASGNNVNFYGTQTKFP